MARALLYPRAGPARVKGRAARERIDAQAPRRHHESRPTGTAGNRHLRARRLRPPGPHSGPLARRQRGGGGAAMKGFVGVGAAITLGAIAALAAPAAADRPVFKADVDAV